VIDRIKVSDSSKMRIYNSLEVGLRYSDGIIIVNDGKVDKLITKNFPTPIREEVSLNLLRILFHSIHRTDGARNATDSVRRK